MCTTNERYVEYRRDQIYSESHTVLYYRNTRNKRDDKLSLAVIAFIQFRCRRRPSRRALSGFSVFDKARRTTSGNARDSFLWSGRKERGNTRYFLTILYCIIFRSVCLLFPLLFAFSLSIFFFFLIIFTFLPPCFLFPVSFSLSFFPLFFFSFFSPPFSFQRFPYSYTRETYEIDEDMKQYDA